MENQIIKIIENDTRNLLHSLNKSNLAKILKFYEIIIEMQHTGLSKNKREIFYQSVPIFKTQITIEILIKRMRRKFGITEEDLLITSSLKGLYKGDVSFITNNGVLENTLLIPDMRNVLKIETQAEIVVVIEKDSFFSFLMQIVENIENFKNVIWVCGKGYPCQNTLRFLNFIKGKMRILGIFDYDPHGIHIYNVYKYGSSLNKKHVIENIQRIGICSSDVLEYKIEEKELIDLSCRDNKMIEKLLKLEEVKGDVLFLKGLKKKMEMEILVGRGKEFIINYLYKKLKLRD